MKSAAQGCPHGHRAHTPLAAQARPCTLIGTRGMGRKAPRSTGSGHVTSVSPSMCPGHWCHLPPATRQAEEVEMVLDGCSLLWAPRPLLVSSGRSPQPGVRAPGT